MTKALARARIPAAALAALALMGCPPPAKETVSPTESTLTVRDSARFWRSSRQLIVMLPD